MLSKKTLYSDLDFESASVEFCPRTLRRLIVLSTSGVTRLTLTMAEARACIAALRAAGDERCELVAAAYRSIGRQASESFLRRSAHQSSAP